MEAGRTPGSPRREDGQEVHGEGRHFHAQGRQRAYSAGSLSFAALGGLRPLVPRLAWVVPRPRPACRLGRSEVAAEAGGGGERSSQKVGGTWVCVSLERYGPAREGDMVEQSYTVENPQLGRRSQGGTLSKS